MEWSTLLLVITIVGMAVLSIACIAVRDSMGFWKSNYYTENAQHIDALKRLKQKQRELHDASQREAQLLNLLHLACDRLGVTEYQMLTYDLQQITKYIATDREA